MLAMHIPYDRELIQRIKTIPGKRWSAERRVWMIPEKYKDIAERIYTEWGNPPKLLETPTHWIQESTTAPWSWQQQGLEYAYAPPATLLWMYMGVGKSRLTLDILRNRKHKNTLIVCPKSVVPVWEEQVEKYMLPDTFTMTCLDTGSVKKNLERAKEAIRYNGRKLLVINYESVWRQPFGDWALEQEWDCIVCDECHALKAPGSRVSRFMYRLGFQAQQRLGLSGTPLPHSPLDAYGVYRFLDPSIFGTNFKKFQNEFAVMGGFNNYQVLEYKNQEEFKRRFHSICYYVPQSVLTLPKYHHIDVPIKLPQKARKIYRNIETDFYSEVGEGTITVDNALVKIVRLSQITSGYLPRDDGVVEELHSSKKEALRDIFAGLEPHEPVVVFCKFTRDLRTVNDVATSQGRGYMELSGAHKELALWEKATSGEVLGVQVKAGSEGVSMVRARSCVWYSIGYSLREYDQGISRLHRPGQERHVTYWHLVVRNSIDGIAYRALQSRREIIEEIVRGSEE